MLEYLIPLAESFAENANDEIAFKMKKYMRDQFDYFGIKSPERKILKKAFLDKNGLPPIDILEDIVKDGWDLPQREFQYVIMEMLDRLSKKAEKERIDMYAYLVEKK